MRTVAKTTALAIVTLAISAIVASGCSSGDSSARKSSPATTIRSAATQSVTPKQAAIALAIRLVDHAVLPPGVRRYDGRLSKVMDPPLQWPDAKNLEEAHRIWSVRGEVKDVAGFLNVHAPHGNGSGGGHAAPLLQADVAFENAVARVLGFSEPHFG